MSTSRASRASGESGKQELARRVASARRARARPPVQGGRRQGGCGGGLGQLGGGNWAGSWRQVSWASLFCFVLYFCFLFVLFYLISFATVLNLK